MSLLLDALKKAAEQKAEKSKEIEAQARPSDETVIDAGPGDVSALDDGGLSPPRRGLQDETELDHSELEARLESARVERDEDDETGLEVGEETSTRVPDPSAQMQSGEDETIIFGAEDVSDFIGDSGREQRRPEDETDLSQVPSADDATGLGRAVPQGDETDLSRLQQDEETDFGQQIFNEDETEFKERIFNEEETELREAPEVEDETDISIPPRQAADSIEQGDAQTASAADETDLSRPVEVDAETAAAMTDEDMSLLLVEREDTNLTGRTSVTDPQVPDDKINVLREDPGDEDLALVDTTRHQAAPEPTTTEATTESRAATSVALDTQTTTEGTTARAETTSTRTYAPDNYDRTLMKLPSDDASRLFAGMKSDADVVMTPDYAKKVFQSKSSAQRLQHYKFYAGIALAILLGIGVFGLFEMQDESFKIETSLRPLKRDPMPGIIKPGGSESTGLTLGTGGVDAQTLKLIETADESGAAEVAAEVAAEGVISSAADTSPETVSEAVETVIASVGTSAADGSGASTGRGETLADSAQAVALAKPVASEDASMTAADSAGSTLQITTASRVDDRAVLLREAYAAYQAGNDTLALSKYNQVLEIDPGNRNALLARAAINVQNNNGAAAIADYQALLLANPKDTLAMTSLLSVANYSPREAETQLKLMLRDEPESPYLNFALANAYGAQNRWQEAQKHYFVALENNPQDPNYAYNLAVSLEHIAKPSVAIAYYQRALDNFNNGLATFNRDVVDQRLETLRKL